MARLNLATDAGGSSEIRHKRSGDASTSPVRVSPKTRGKLDQLLRQANKDRLGRRVKPDDIMAFALGLVTDEHLAMICNQTLSNKDRMEVLFRRIAKERRGLNREEFFGLLLDGKLTD